MARCFYCCHCGKCGPGSGGGGALNPPGYCPFCKTQNAPDAEVCSSCGKKLPRAAGVSVSAAEPPADGVPTH
ncbi:MAG: hypothetical protein ACOX69_02370 [Coriobacteriales bacterium]